MAAAYNKRTALRYGCPTDSGKRRPVMAIDFTVKDVMHKIAVKFVHAFLPDAKKPYNLKAVHQPELDIHGVASKGACTTSEQAPKLSRRA